MDAFFPLQWLLLIFHLVIMPVAAFHALVYKRDHRAALGWIGFILVLPVIGPLVYFSFGINRIRTRARLFTGRHLPVMQFGFERPEKRPGPDFEDDIATALENPPMAMVGGRVTGAPLEAGNRLEMLVNGEQFFPRLVECLDNAQREVLLSSYLFSFAGISKRIVDSLARAQDRGATVYVLIDGLGALYSLRRAIRPLKRAGVRVSLFMPPTLLPPSFAINLRNHRKIAVIDGGTGFFGGINIDQRHMVEDTENPQKTEDVHFEIQGPAVTQLRRVFAEDWWLATGKDLAPDNGATALFENPGAGDATCRVIQDGPDESLDHLGMTMNGIFASARHRITIMVPYFLPSREMMAVLQTAVLRGVEVRIILPEKSNLRVVDWASRNMLWELVLWGVVVYFKPAPFAHTKLIAVDGHYVLGGSANLDPRSLRLNFELGVEIFDETLAKQVETHLKAVLTGCRPVTLEELDGRSLAARARDAFFWLFSSYL